MKNVKKTIVTVLGLCLLTASAGCSTEVKKENADAETVTVWTANGHDKSFLEEQINEWNKTTGKERGIRIDYVVHDGNIADKLDLAFKTDQAPDLFSGGNLSQYVELGYIAAYEDIPGGDKLVEKYKDYLMYGRHKYIDGKCYMLPKTSATFGLIYNKDMFKAAGIVDENGEAKPPETLEELREYAKILTDTSKRQYGFIFAGKSGVIYNDDVMKMSSATSGFVDGYNPKTGTFDYTAEGEVMKTMLGIKEDGSYYPGVEGLDNDQARARFAAGSVGMKTAGSYDYGVLTSQFPASIDWGVAPFPSAEKGVRQKQHMGNYGYLMINKKSVEEKADKLLPVLEFFYGDDLIKKSYENGIDLPLDWSLVKDINVQDNMKQWRDFGSLIEISISSPLPVGRSADGMRAMKTIYIEDIWTGKIPVSDIDSTCADYSKQQNEAAKEYLKIHPDYDPSLYVIPDWDSSIK